MIGFETHPISSDALWQHCNVLWDNHCRDLQWQLIITSKSQSYFVVATPNDSLDQANSWVTPTVPQILGVQYVLCLLYTKLLDSLDIRLLHDREGWYCNSLKHFCLWTWHLWRRSKILEKYFSKHNQCIHWLRREPLPPLKQHSAEDLMWCSCDGPDGSYIEKNSRQAERQYEGGPSKTAWWVCYFLYLL